jgi:transporter family-2 protein
MYYILAFIAGTLTIISMVTNATLAKYVGTAQSTFVNFIAGLLISLIMFFFFNNQSLAFINFPLWALLGGFLAVFIVIITNLVIPKIPAIYTSLLIFIGQLLTGIIIDFLVNHSANKNKIIGVSIIVLGLFFNFMVDKKDNKKEINLKCENSIS